MKYDFTLKDGAEEVSSSDVYYDFFQGGYISEHALLADEATANAVMDARLLIEDFLLSVVSEEC